MKKYNKRKVDRCRYAHLHFRGDYTCVQAGWDDDKVVATDAKKCAKCKLFKSKYIEYPLTINGIEEEKIDYERSLHANIGDLVAVRPCTKMKGKTTFLGIYLGELPQCIMHRFNEQTGVLKAETLDNPAIFVPELKKIVWGSGSWWHRIKSEEQLREITDEDINNTWYVKMAKELSK